MNEHHYEKFIGFAAIIIILGIIGYLFYSSSNNATQPVVQNPITVTPSEPVVAAHKTISEYLSAPMLDASITASWKTYTDAKNTFSIRYPADWKVNSSYVNSTNGPAMERSGVSFTVPATLAKGTNLSSDSTVSVETNTLSSECVASDFLDAGMTTAFDTVTINGHEWTIAKGGDAGAGNLYEQIVASQAGMTPCRGVRLFIHSTQLGNYDPGTITAFDRNQLLSVYETMLASYTVK